MTQTVIKCKFRQLFWDGKKGYFARCMMDGGPANCDTCPKKRVEVK